MAIDSEEKRKAVASLGLVWAPGVTPNATMDNEWRSEVAVDYPGVLPGAAGTSVGSEIFSGGIFHSRIIS